jgi:CubicO group peptidase (beta-lactamase class C family)
MCRVAIALRLVLLLAGTSGTAFAATVSCATLARQMHHRHIPDVAVAVFSQGKVQSVFCSSSGTPLSPGSIFEAASLSKPVFAYGVLKLVEDHRLDLDKPLAEYLDRPYEHHQNPFGQGTTDPVSDPRFAKITARMVLSHTSGLPNWSHHGPLSFLSDPGEKWSYSGEGYVYLQRVVEAITGLRIDAFLENTVLLPLGMNHSSFIWQAGFADHALPGHSTAGEPAPIDHFFVPVVSTTLYTTLGDYSRFLMQLLTPATHSPLLMEEQSQEVARPHPEPLLGTWLGDRTSPADLLFSLGCKPWLSVVLSVPANHRKRNSLSYRQRQRPGLGGYLGSRSRSGEPPCFALPDAPSEGLRGVIRLTAHEPEG